MIPLSYQSKPSALHKRDPRCKLAALLLLSIAAGVAHHWWQLGILATVAFMSLFAARLPFKQLAQSLWFFGVIIVAVIVSYALTFGGPALFSFGNVSVSAEGFEAGLKFGAKLLIIIAICSAITAATSPSDLGGAVTWFLHPLPFVPAARIGTAINLTLVFIPMSFTCYTEVHAAARSRCIDLQKNPIRRITFLVRPVLEVLFLRVERMATAMEARCYNDDRVLPVYHAADADIALVVLSIGLLALALL